MLKVVVGTYAVDVKIRVLRREIEMRQRMYPWRVSHGHISQAEAEFEIDVMQAILKDYEEQGIKKLEMELREPRRTLPP
jgi:Cdc6-like AAA superfamily ATPase